ncbi:MAG: hypothetical protein KGH64_02885 [Candidatus Micrarchaeota archaeon]|nr:hypothetical protein [Candidatus Micrarchaeota archaeon]
MPLVIARSNSEGKRIMSDPYKDVPRETLIEQVMFLKDENGRLKQKSSKKPMTTQMKQAIAMCGLSVLGAIGCLILGLTWDKMNSALATASMCAFAFIMLGAVAIVFTVCEKG